MPAEHIVVVRVFNIQLTGEPYSNVQEQCWVWPSAGQEYFYDKHEWVRIRVEQEHWHDLSPVAPSERETAAALERKSPYSITVGIFL
jgi:DNA-directed RNA polymerase III subunit RPC8